VLTKVKKAYKKYKKT